MKRDALEKRLARLITSNRQKIAGVGHAMVAPHLKAPKVPAVSASGAKLQELINQGLGNPNANPPVPGQPTAAALKLVTGGQSTKQEALSRLQKLRSSPNFSKNYPVLTTAPAISNLGPGTLYRLQRWYKNNIQNNPARTEAFKTQATGAIKDLMQVNLNKPPASVSRTTP